jgi:very-short-patch-repair endonuclease
LESRSLGLARVVAEGFGRDGVVLLMRVDPDLTPDGERAMVAGAEWLAHQGRLGFWLVGAPLRHVDRVTAVQVTPSRTVAELSTWGPDSGRPHPASATEAALEAALARESWATGRAWNQTYQSHALTAPVRLDLLWQRERCVIEVDGPEHCHPVRFEADRRRDVQLQLDGYAVLRFTNARVSHDVGAVVHQIGTYLRARRRDIAEGRKHGRR